VSAQNKFGSWVDATFEAQAMSPPGEAARADVVTIMTTVLIGLGGVLAVLFQALTSERSEKGSVARSTWCVAALLIAAATSIILCLIDLIPAATGWQVKSRILQSVLGKCSTCTMVLCGLRASRRSLHSRSMRHLARQATWWCAVACVSLSFSSLSSLQGTHTPTTASCLRS
jgi:hypothetical protein